MRYPVDPDPRAASSVPVLVRARARSIPRLFPLSLVPPAELRTAYRDWRSHAAPTANVHRWPRWQQAAFLLLVATLCWIVVIGAAMAAWWFVLPAVAVLLLL